MKVIRDRLDVSSAPERGFSLVEVMVAMLIFGLVAIGLIYTMAAVLAVNRDSRVRQVAANLAAQEIDLARDVEDVPSFGGNTRTITLNGDTFEVVRTSFWVSNPDEISDTCGTGGGTLKYKRIHVEVTWGGMRGDTGVTSDTLINPNERINHPDLGTIMVTVQNSHGQGLEDVTVEAVVEGGSSVVATATTDANGCAYLLQVAPETYELTLDGSSGETFIDISTNSQPKEIAPAVAGVATAARFDVDIAGVLDINYTHDGSPVSPHQLPDNFGTSLIGTTNTTLSERQSNSDFPEIAIAPGTSYAVIAGDMRTCAFIDPQNWPETGSLEQGERGPSVTPVSGVTTDVDIPVRVIEVDDVHRDHIMAVSQNESVGCATEVVYEFDPINGHQREIALPYGHWDLYKRSNTWNSWQDISSYRIDVDGNDSLDGRTVILDPRVSK